MVKRRRCRDCDGTTNDAAAGYNHLFITTNLDTNLAFMFADSETVSQLKDNIEVHHRRCFPEIGEVKIHAVKVEKNGTFYHLADFMFVKLAFEGVNESPLLYVDFSKCNDVLQIMKHGATNQTALLTTNLHDQDHIRDDCFKIPCDIHKEGVADVGNGSSSKPGCNFPSSTQEFKDYNVPDDVRNLGSCSSGQSVGTCNSAKRLKRKHNSLLATSASKDNNISPQALHSNKLQLETEITPVSIQNNTNKLLGSHVESEPQRDGQEMSSSNAKKSKQNRKGSLYLHEQAHSSLSLAKCAGVNECIMDNAESEKGCASPGKDNRTASASICLQGRPNSSHYDKTVETNLLALHDPEVNCTGQLNPTDGLEKSGESALPSKLSDTKEVSMHGKRSKKRAKSSKSQLLEAHVDQARNLTVDSNLVMPDTNGQELPETAESDLGNHDLTEQKLLNVAVSDNQICQSTVEKGNCSSKADARAVKQNLSTNIGDTDEATEGLNSGGEKKKKKKMKKSGDAVKDQQNREIIVAENDLSSKQVPETELCSKSECPDVLKDFEVNEPTEDGKALCEKKRKQKVEKAVASVQETVDTNREADQMNEIVSPSLDSPGEGVKGGGKKKKKKMKKSGAVVSENDLSFKQVPATDLPSNSGCQDVLQGLEVNEAARDGTAIHGTKKKVKRSDDVVADNNLNLKQVPETDLPSNSESPDVVMGSEVNDAAKDGTAIREKKKKVRKSGGVVAENDLNLKQVPETNLPLNSECPDVLKRLEVNKAAKDGTAIREKKKKQEVQKAVERVQEKGDMNRDADQINDIPSPPLDNPDNNSVPPGENDEKVGEIDVLVKSNLEEMARDRSSNRDHEELVIEAVSKTNTSTASVDADQKMSGRRMKRRAKKTVSGVLQDGMDTENYQTSTDTDRHADLQVEKDKDLLLGSKGIEASAMKSSDRSIGKNTSPMLNQVSAKLKTQKDGVVSECIGKEIDFKQYFVPSQHQDEVFREPSAGTVAKKKREEVVVPSAVSAPTLQQDFPKSSKKDGISSAGKTNTLTESNRVTKTKKKNGKRGVPYATTSSDLDEIRTPQKPMSSALLNGSDATKTMARKKEIVKSLASAGVNSSFKTPLKSNKRDRNGSTLKHHVTAGKNKSSKLDGEVVNKFNQRKSLGKTPKAIFRDISSESSLDENGSVDSTASTRTPSDNLSSASESDDAMGNARGDKDKGRNQKRVSNSEISDTEQIPLDTILKSSSRFKKAKLTASQQFEDPDSQFDDFLPETQL